ncbi:MAG: ribosome recycling factor [Gammaproteobacteria bacterium]|jgi:ribosome recycling factor
MNSVIQDASKRMQKAIESLQNEFKKMRSGRAHPSLLDQIMVPYYGNDTPLSQVANINIEDARTLSVTPWDKQMVAAIEKAIRTSELGLNPATNGTVIRIPLPALTEERRKDLVKVVRHETEGARVSIRNIRRDANTAIKALVKDKTISEDDERRLEDQVQKLTDDFIKEVDKLLTEKEHDLMSV